MDELQARVKAMLTERANAGTTPALAAVMSHARRRRSRRQVASGIFMAVMLTGVGVWAADLEPRTRVTFAGPSSIDESEQAYFDSCEDVSAEHQPMKAAGWSRVDAPPLPLNDAVAANAGERSVVFDSRAETGALYDIRDASWQCLPPLPVEVGANPAVVATDEFVVVWGGEGPDEGALWSRATDRWRSMAPSPLQARPGIAAVWTGREVLFWGGVQSGIANYDGASYDPDTDRWTTLPAAPAGLNEFDAVWTGSELIVFGAMLGAGNAAETKHAIGMAFSPSTQSWRRLPPVALSPQASAVAWDGERLVAWDYLRAAAEYDLGTDSWSALPDLPFNPMECQPGAVALRGGQVLAWYCGQAAVLNPGISQWELLDSPRGGGGTLLPSAHGALLVGVSDADRDLEVWRYDP